MKRAYLIDYWLLTGPKRARHSMTMHLDSHQKAVEAACLRLEKDHGAAGYELVSVDYVFGQRWVR